MASASEAAVTIGGAPNLAFLEFQHLVSGDYHLRYSLAVRDDDGFTTVVLHQHTPFAVVIRIDRAGRVRNHQRRLEAGATPGPYLSLVADRKRSTESERNYRPFTWKQLQNHPVAIRIGPGRSLVLAATQAQLHYRVAQQVGLEVVTSAACGGSCRQLD